MSKRNRPKRVRLVFDPPPPKPSVPRKVRKLVRKSRPSPWWWRR